MNLDNDADDSLISKKAAYIKSAAKPKLPAAKAAAVPKMVSMIQAKKKPAGSSY